MYKNRLLLGIFLSLNSIDSNIMSMDGNPFSGLRSRSHAYHDSDSDDDCKEIGSHRAGTPMPSFNNDNSDDYGLYDLDDEDVVDLMVGIQKISSFSSELDNVSETNSSGRTSSLGFISPLNSKASSCFSGKTSQSTFSSISFVEDVSSDEEGKSKKKRICLSIDTGRNSVVTCDDSLITDKESQSSLNKNKKCSFSDSITIIGKKPSQDIFIPVVAAALQTDTHSQNISLQKKRSFCSDEDDCEIESIVSSKKRRSQYKSAYDDDSIFIPTAKMCSVKKRSFDDVDIISSSSNLSSLSSPSENNFSPRRKFIVARKNK